MASRQRGGITNEVRPGPNCVSEASIFLGPCARTARIKPTNGNVTTSTTRSLQRFSERWVSSKLANLRIIVSPIEIKVPGAAARIRLATDGGRNGQLGYSTMSGRARRFYACRFIRPDAALDLPC